MSQVYVLPDYVRVNGLDGSLVEKTAPSFPKEQKISLESARNQAVSFQIVIAPQSGKLAKLEVETSCKDTDVFMEWFHSHLGMYVPDMLIPFNESKRPFSIPMCEEYLPNQKVGALWVDVWVPKEAPVGKMQKIITIKADGETYEIKAEINVRSMVVPDKSRITADLNNYSDNISPNFPHLKDNPNRYTDGSYLKIEQAMTRMAREHKSVFHLLPYRHSGIIQPSFAPTIEGAGKNMKVKSWEAYDEHFGPYLDGSVFKGCRFGEHPLEYLYLPFHLGWPANYENFGKKGYRTEYRRILNAFVQHVEEKGWKDTKFEVFLNHKKDYRFFPYTVDEIWYEHDREAMDIYWDVIKDVYETSNAQFVFRLDDSNHYGNHYNSKFSDWCKLWVVGFGMFQWFPESMAVMNEKKAETWVYGGIVQPLDANLISLYSFPINCLMMGSTGFVAWNTTGFGPDPLKCPVNGGSELFFYPGNKFGIEGPVPSLRLKVLRNAMQLVDLVMTHKATPTCDKLEAVVCNAYGMNSAADWWHEKPPFVDSPPRYWDFGESFGNWVNPPLEAGKAVDICHNLTNALYDVMEDNTVELSTGVVFKYQ